jgi:nucleoside-diphosphate-sugar epimerase
MRMKSRELYQARLCYSQEMTPVCIVGCGYTGLALATRLIGSGVAVRGYSTRPESLAEIAARGARAATLDLDQTAKNLDFGGEICVYSVPPAPSGAEDSRLLRFLAALRSFPQQMIYLSTTGVYGDHGAALVDEDAVTAPSSDRAKRRLAAEQAWRRWAEANGVPWTILRIAGIYGPGRLPIERLTRGDPAIRHEEAHPGNRIHRDDLVSACIAATLSLQAHRRLFNVSDGNHESASAFLERVARIANLPPPPLVSRAEARQSLSPMALSFLDDARRIDNRRLLEELGVVLAYQDLDAGIRASL